MAYDLWTKKQTPRNWAIGCGTPARSRARMAGDATARPMKRRKPGIGAFVGRALAQGVPVPVVQKALVQKGYDPNQIAAIVGQYRR